MLVDGASDPHAATSCAAATHTTPNPQARRALEERRAERARMDDLMRHPSQAPAPPKKPILRKGSGAVLRSPPRGTAAAGAGGSFGAPRPSTVPARSSGSPAGGRSPGRSPVRAVTACADGQRREWSEGLKHFIAGQREAGRPYGLATQVRCSLNWAETQSLYMQLPRTLMKPTP